MSTCRAATAVLAAATFVFGLASVTASASAAPPKTVTSDFDGDGRSDLAIGAPGINRVHVSYTHARPGGSSVTALRPDSRPKTQMSFGATLATGDFNDDGYADLAVAAPQYANKTHVGAVFVFLGSAAGLRNQPTLIVVPDEKDSDLDSLNTIALASGRADADRFADLAVVTPGGVRVYYGGGVGVQVSGSTKLSARVGESVAFGDVNGDHRDDLVVGIDNGLDGVIDAYFGRAHGLSTKRHSIEGKQVGAGPYEWFGLAIAAGDFNGDGYTDIATGVPDGEQTGSQNDPGYVLVLFGAAAGLSKKRVQHFDEIAVDPAPKHNDEFGTTLATGNIGKDGHPDLVVAATGAKVGGRPSAGAIYVIHGSKHGLTGTNSQRFTQSSSGVPGTPEKGGQFGTALYIGDVTGNSHEDLVIGTPFQRRWHGYVVTLRGTGTGLTTQHATSTRAAHKSALFGSAIA